MLIPPVMEHILVLDWNWLAMEAHAGNIIKKRQMSFTFQKTPRISKELVHA